MKVVQPYRLFDTVFPQTLPRQLDELPGEFFIYSRIYSRIGSLMDRGFNFKNADFMHVTALYDIR